MTMLQLLMKPSNKVCDLLRMTDAHERGMVRMLVNTLIWTTFCVTLMLVVWILVD
jgi:hypothetical protein